MHLLLKFIKNHLGCTAVTAVPCSLKYHSPNTQFSKMISLLIKIKSYFELKNASLFILKHKSNKKDNESGPLI